MEKNVFIKTWGCAANKAESEIMAGILSKLGFYMVRSYESAQIVIFNTCGVKQTTKNKILFELKRTQQEMKDKIFIVTGCLPEIDYKAVKEAIPSANIISTNYITKIGTFIRKILDGERIEILGKEKSIKVGLPKIRENKVIDIVPVCSGCLMNCSYCATKLAKGDLFSYPPTKIIQEIKSMKNYGIKEFWLTGQDVSAYGFDFNYEYKLPDLLRDITDEIRGNYFIRIGMLNPIHLKVYLERFIKELKKDNIFKFVHIPVQSGSDKILNLMKRGYRASDFIKIVKRIREEVPDVTIWTDIIVGFPEETEDDFEETKKLILKTKPDWINVSRFSSHPGTEAHKMKQVKSEIKKRRSRELSKIVEEIAYERNKRWSNRKGKVLIDEVNIKERNIIGRNYAYKQVVFPLNKNMIGKFVNVRIKEVKPTHLVGKLDFLSLSPKKLKH